DLSREAAVELVGNAARFLDGLAGLTERREEARCLLDHLPHLRLQRRILQSLVQTSKRGWQLREMLLGRFQQLRILLYQKAIRIKADLHEALLRQPAVGGG